MLPLHDDNPTRSTPVVTIALILINVLVFLYQLSIGLETSVIRFGLIPAELLQGADNAYGGRQLGLPPGEVVQNLNPAPITLLTSMFMHGGWMHIIGNMWFLWIFGNNVEDSMGKVKYVLFYLFAGAVAAAAQIATGPGDTIPMVGASGAIGGVLGAYLVLFPGSRVIALIPLGFIWFTRALPAWIVLGFWFVLEFIRGATALGGQNAGGVAYAAHVGGFVTGVVLGRLLGVVHRHEEYSRGDQGYGGYRRRYDNTDWR
ncbi:MAG: rhomboid family intramembrane serine protease [Armatimonadota bacterium]